TRTTGAGRRLAGGPGVRLDWILAVGRGGDGAVRRLSSAAARVLCRRAPVGRAVDRVASAVPRAAAGRRRAGAGARTSRRDAMKWHVLTGEYPPQRGGVSTYTKQVARG